MKDKIGGIILIIAGIAIMVNPKYYSYAYSITVDFSEIKFPLGFAFIVIGSAIIWFAQKRK